MQDAKIDHAEHLQKMIDVYDRPIMATVERWFPLGADADRRHIKSMLRQAIEQAFDEGHACHSHHS